MSRLDLNADSIVEFLTARLDERERYARQALDSPDSATTGTGVRIVDGELAIMPSAMSMGLTLHFVNHSPARVLAEVAAKRRTLARHSVTGAKRDYPDLNACEGCGSKGYGYGYRTPDINDCPELRDMAAPYEQHPDYDPAWRVE